MYCLLLINAQSHNNILYYCMLLPIHTVCVTVCMYHNIIPLYLNQFFACNHYDLLTVIFILLFTFSYNNNNIHYILHYNNYYKSYHCDNRDNNNSYNIKNTKIYTHHIIIFP